TYTAIVSAPNPDLLLFPGMTAVLRVQVHETDDTLKVSNQALRFRPKTREANTNPSGSQQVSTDNAVWILDDGGSLVRVPIQVGASDENNTQITTGALREGQQVIVGIAT